MRTQRSSCPIINFASGDLDASWEDVVESGSETVAGDNPAPDQSLAEENAQAMGLASKKTKIWALGVRSSIANDTRNLWLTCVYAFGRASTTRECAGQR